jgi:hypothetical protein
MVPHKEGHVWDKEKGRFGQITGVLNPTSSRMWVMIISWDTDIHKMSYVKDYDYRNWYNNYVFFDKKLTVKEKLAYQLKNG